MKQRLLFLLRYVLFWLIFFEFSRLFFLLYNASFTTNTPFVDILQSFTSGFRHDLSLLGYVSAIVAIVSIISLFATNFKRIQRVLDCITIVLLIPFSILLVSDAELYRNWGYRTDCSVLQYLATPKEAMASLPLWHTGVLVLLSVVFFVLFYLFYKKWVSKCVLSFTPTSKWFVLLYVGILGLMVIPIRGGVGVATLRTGSVYFSSQTFANHAAINDYWHFLYSFAYQNRERPEFFMEQEECDSICSHLLKENDSQPISLLNTQRPNVLVFILESFTADHIGVLGGIEGVTPCLDSIAKSGVLFRNCYGNGTKSEMGIVSVLSGYPALPKTAIIKYNEKAEKLPYLSKLFDSLGYELSLYHGGDIHFANMNSYFRFGGFEKCVTIDDFDSKDGTAKWGAFDHVVMQRMYKDLHSVTKPFFTVCYTLSSHEPFDVPMKSEFLKNDEYSKFLNSIHYADSCLGDFMNKARNESWWENTLIVFVSDHGARISKNAQIVSSQEKFHIPMIWSGGAIRKDTVIDNLLCQCDFPKMLCNQLKLNSKQFVFSKDVLKSDNAFAFYAFNNGFGYLYENQSFSWDNTNSQIITQTDNLQDTTVMQGKALLQKVTTDFCEK